MFISHPFSGDEIQNRQLVDKACKQIINQHENILPISPLHLWSFLETDRNYREKIMEFCYRMIDNSDQIWFYLYDELSEGQQKELIYAVKTNKAIKFIDGYEMLDYDDYKHLCHLEDIDPTDFKDKTWYSHYESLKAIYY